ncbi:UNVERIFIED_CONTAM: hypothetical protein FKN15_047685 [Acipenser sinensis]
MGCLWMFWAFFCLAVTPVLCVPPVGLQPEQVHVSYTGVPQSMIITWTTFNKTESWVEYGVWGGKLFQLTAQGSCTLFKDGGDEGRKLYMHRVTLTHLKPGTAYGINDGWSDILFFTAIKEGSEWSPKFALFGDLGNDNPQSLARLQKETQLGMYDVILHIGDFAYDMDEVVLKKNSKTIQYINAILETNVQAAKNGPAGRMFDTPALDKGLAKSTLSVTLPKYHRVDLELWAHEHTYERLWPVYGFQVFNGSMEHPYVNPRAPVHIITGSAGCREKHDGFIPAPRDWSAFRSTDYGYTRMQILNSTHLYLEQVSDDQVRGAQLPCSLPYGLYTELRFISLAQEVYCICTSHCCLQRTLKEVLQRYSLNTNPFSRES